MNPTLHQILLGGREHSATDVHLVRGIAPAYRVGGQIRLSSCPALDQADLSRHLAELLTPRQLSLLDERRQLCLSHSWPGVGRFRASVYFHGGVGEMAIRLAETRIRPREQLRLPPVIDELTHKPNGLILIVGPTGVGKTTTLNYMIDLINRQRRCKIITIEDPVEFTHENSHSIIVQQEVHTDTPSFGQALIHALRQDPDVIAIGEMRDLETISTALTAAETGHLVLATLHTPDVVQTIQRIFGVFPSQQQNHVMYELSNCLQAVIAQNLLPSSDGRGLVLACEVCVVTPSIRKLIRGGEAHLIHNELQTGRKHQMQTMDGTLADLYQQGEITYEAALSAAHDPQRIRQRAV